MFRRNLLQVLLNAMLKSKQLHYTKSLLRKITSALCKHVVSMNHLSYLTIVVSLQSVSRMGISDSCRLTYQSIFLFLLPRTMEELVGYYRDNIMYFEFNNMNGMFQNNDKEVGGCPRGGGLSAAAVDARRACLRQAEAFQTHQVTYLQHSDNIKT